MEKEWALSIGNLPLGGLPRNSVDRITDHPNMTSTVYHGSKVYVFHKSQTQIGLNYMGMIA